MNRRTGAEPFVGDRPLIGILGGMGPAASLDLYAKVVALTPATGDREHVRLIIEGDPDVPDRQAALAGSGPSAAAAIVTKALRLKAAGVDVIAMACNAAHAYVPDVVQATGLPFISLVDEAAAAAIAAAPASGAIGLLATPATLDAGLYDGPLTDAGRRVITPDHIPSGRGRLMDLVWKVKAGDVGPTVRAGMTGIAAELVAAGAGVVIAACTEVPLVLDQQDVEVPLIDATAALAARLVALGLEEVHAAFSAE